MTKVMTMMSALLLICAVQFSACSRDDNAEGPEQRFLQRLSFTWTIDNAKVDNKDVTTAFPNLSLIVTGSKTFTTANAVDPIWPASGNFTLVPVEGSENYIIRRSDGIDMTVTELSTNRLIVEFSYTATGGRMSSVSGDYVFVFKR